MWLTTLEAAMALRQQGWARLDAGTWGKMTAGRMVRLTLERCQNGNLVWFAPALEEIEVCEAKTVVTRRPAAA